MSIKARKKMNTSLLYNDYPIPVSPALATAIGLNEAIILQQMHYWTALPDENGRLRNVRDGHSWVYNSVSTWSRQFPFWSESTIRRTLASLEKQGLVITGNYNRDKRDRTKWYRVDYRAVAALNQAPSPFVQNEQMQMPNMARCVGSECTNASGQNDQTITRDYTETSSETNNPPSPGGDLLGSEEALEDETPGDPDVTLPEWLDVEAWQAFVEHRKQIKARMTAKAKTMLLNKLARLRDQGHDPAALLEESIINGWKGVFEPKAPQGGRQALPRGGFAETDYREGLEPNGKGGYWL